MTNIIKLRFVRKGEPAGMAYTYYTPTEVRVGDLVDVESKVFGCSKSGEITTVSQGIVTEVDVPESEIAPFKDRAKTIIGKSAEKDIEREDK